MMLFQALLFGIIQNVELKSIFPDLGYLPVPSCPKSAREWEESSLRLNCNDTHKYHCTPYLNKHNIYQLYELCYISFKVSKEKCLVIRGDGRLNENNCEKFLSGCPNDDYNSSDINQYPKCLGVQGDCFTEDRYCVCLNEKTQNSAATPLNDKSRPNVTTNSNCTCASGQNTCDPHQGVYFIPFVISICFCIPSLFFNFLILWILWIRKCCIQISRRGFETEESAEENTNLVHSPTGGEQPKVSCVIGGEISTPAVEKKPLVPDPIDNIHRMTLVDFTIEDEQLFKLLKRQCLHGVPSEFKYLVKTRVKHENCKKEYIFEQKDENGCILLHYAAQGGNIIILDEILKITSNKILENKCIRGQSALHFAIKHKQKDMAEHLIELYSVILSKKNEDTESTETEINEENKCKPVEESTETDLNEEKKCTPVEGEFSPVHLVAWCGETRLLDSLMKIGFDILAKTRNGLNILDIACMNNVLGESDVEFEFCEHLLRDKSFNIDPQKIDISGWNIAHYASLSNFKLFEYIASNKEICDIIMVKTKAKKTCLHIACEFGKTEIVEFIVNDPKLKKLISHTDALGWNALHFAAKGGKLKILEDLLNKKGMEIGCKTDDGKTLLHIACIHKQKYICKFVLNSEEFAENEDLLNAKTTNNGLTAAHYLAVEKKEDGSEKDIFEMLIKSKMKLLTKNKRGLTILEFAVDHLNKELIECIVSAICNGKLDISVGILSKCINDTKDKSIKQILQTGMDRMKS